MKGRSLVAEGEEFGDRSVQLHTASYITVPSIPCAARPGYQATDDSMTTASSVNNLGSGCNLAGEGGTNAVDSAIFQVPRM